MRIRTPARLHFGFIDPFGRMGRAYGSIGVAIAEPSWVIEVDPAGDFSVDSEDPEVISRIEGIIKRGEEILGQKISLRFKVLSSIPFHRGLGAGTQLSLAVSEAIFRTLGLSYSKSDVIALSGRGKRSGIGISAYFEGGFILDVGKRVDKPSYPLSLFRLSFPSDWVFLVVLPEVELNIHGEVEERKFEVIKDVNVYEISYLILMGLLPSLLEEDIEGFGKCLTLIQRKVGEMFIDSQGGVFAHEICERLIYFMLEEGAYGAGQSSWGPTVYGVVKRGSEAESLKRKLVDFMSSNHIRGNVWLAGVNLSGRELL